MSGWTRLLAFIAGVFFFFGLLIGYGYVKDSGLEAAAQFGYVLGFSLGAVGLLGLPLWAFIRGVAWVVAGFRKPARSG